MRNIYDNSEFFAAYAEMGRSKDGLKAAGEWHQLQPLFPKLQGKKVLDLGCGYGWHCKYAAQMGATEILGIDSSQKMIAKAVADNSDDKIKYKVCGVDEYSGAPEAPVRYPGKQESGRMGSIGPLMCGGAASTVTKGCASNDLHLCNY